MSKISKVWDRRNPTLDAEEDTVMDDILLDVVDADEFRRMGIELGVDIVDSYADEIEPASDSDFKSLNSERLPNYNSTTTHTTSISEESEESIHRTLDLMGALQGYWSHNQNKNELKEICDKNNVVFSWEEQSGNLKLGATTHNDLDETVKSLKAKKVKKVVSERLGFGSYLRSDEGKAVMEKMQQNHFFNVTKNVYTVDLSGFNLPKIQVVQGDMVEEVLNSKQKLCKVLVPFQNHVPIGTSAANVNADSRIASKTLHSINMSALDQRHIKRLFELFLSNSNQAKLLVIGNFHDDLEVKKIHEQARALAEAILAFNFKFGLPLPLIKLVDKIGKVGEYWIQALLETLKEIMQNRQEQSQSPVRIKMGSTLGKPAINFGVWDILKRPVGFAGSYDTLVNSARKSLDLFGAGGLSRKIAEIGGPNLVQECKVVGATNVSFKTAVTSGGNLWCTRILHIQNSSIRDEWALVLKDLFCTVSKATFITGLAIPALGSGGCGMDPKVMANLMCDIIKSTTFQTTLERIMFVFEDATTMKIYQDAFDHRNIPLNEAYPDENQGVDLNLIHIEESMEFEVVSSDEKELLNIESILLSLGEDISPEESIFMSNDVLQILHPKTDIFNELCFDFGVNFFWHQKFHKPSLLFMEGRKLHEALLKLQPLIHKAESIASRTLIGIRWYFLKNSVWTAYKKPLALHMENAYQNSEKRVMIPVDANTSYEIDLVNFCERKNAELPTELKVKRHTIEDKIPFHWEISSHNNIQQTTPNVVELSRTSNEFQKVVASISNDLQKKITKIERVENLSLWKQYMVMKEQVEKETPRGYTVERLLFHGTNQDVIPNINTENFNRSYAGTNAGKAFGAGNYFAVDFEVSYNNYAKENAKGEKKVYQARVLTGYYTQGASTMLVAPARPDNKGRFHSTVDNTSSPKYFVTFPDTAAYPEYIITVRSQKERCPVYLTVHSVAAGPAVATHRTRNPTVGLAAAAPAIPTGHSVTSSSHSVTNIHGVTIITRTRTVSPSLHSVAAVPAVPAPRTGNSAARYVTAAPAVPTPRTGNPASRYVAASPVVFASRTGNPAGRYVPVAPAVAAPRTGNPAGRYVPVAPVVAAPRTGNPAGRYVAAAPAVATPRTGNPAGRYVAAAPAVPTPRTGNPASRYVAAAPAVPTPRTGSPASRYVAASPVVATPRTGNPASRYVAAAPAVPAPRTGNPASRYVTAAPAVPTPRTGNPASRYVAASPVVSASRTGNPAGRYVPVAPAVAAPRTGNPAGRYVPVAPVVAAPRTGNPAGNFVAAAPAVATPRTGNPENRPKHSEDKNPLSWKLLGL